MEQTGHQMAQAQPEALLAEEEATTLPKSNMLC